MNPKQSELFPRPLPEGVQYQAGFLSNRQAALLFDTIDKLPWRNDLKRRVQHYGYHYDYKTRRARRQDYLGPLPDWAQELAQRLASDGHFSHQPDQVIVNEYQPGQGIAAHVDCVPCFGGCIAAISLNSGCMMRFEHRKTGQVLDQYLEPRSLLVMQGAGRYDWTHGIAARKSDVVGGGRMARGRRVSMTFRTMAIK